MGPPASFEAIRRRRARSVADAHMRVPICRQRLTASECAKWQRGSSLPYFGPPASRSHARSVVHGRALAASPGAPLTWVACRQDWGHQMLQRADEVLLAHQDGAVAGMDDVDRASWGCPVGRGMARTCSMRFSQRPASVRLEVSSARRRMLPSQAISVITTLTQTSLPASARETASHLWQRHECRKVQRDPCYALGSPAVVAEHPRMRVTPNIRGARVRVSGPGRARISQFGASCLGWTVRPRPTAAPSAGCLRTAGTEEGSDRAGKLSARPDPFAGPAKRA
jgi:hypothetical protein